MTIKEKILSYLEATGKVKADFYKAIDASPSNFKGAGKNSALSSDKIAKILSLYPDLSPDWLLNGVGDMLRSTALTDSILAKTSPLNTEDKIMSAVNDDKTTIKKQVKNRNASSIREKGVIPLVSERAVGGFSNGDFSVAERDVIAYYTVPKFRNLGVDFMIELTGDSMIPRFSPGDIIACSIITNPSFIQWNRCHLIASREQGLIVKRLMPGKNDMSLKAVSENPAYPPFDIPKDDICGLALIVGSIHLE